MLFFNDNKFFSKLKIYFRLCGDSEAVVKEALYFPVFVCLSCVLLHSVACLCECLFPLGSS